ncbi:hypothetical protein BTVI_109384 [Pitangus sulphuratus]|nr:hypothetical protein BTVI_109384 [Pitangus sulphuratus]
MGKRLARINKRSNFDPLLTKHMRQNMQKLSERKDICAGLNGFISTTKKGRICGDVGNNCCVSGMKWVLKTRVEMEIA